jgi:type II secretion system protein N
MALPIPTLGPRASKIARYVGFVLVFIVVFLFAFQLTFPYERLKDKLVELSAEKFELTVGDVERGIMPGRVYFKAVTLRFRPAKAGDVPSTMFIEQLQADVGILSLLHGTVTGKADLKLGPGHLKLAVAASTSSLSAEIEGEDVPAASLPAREFVGLPISGKLKIAGQFEAPITKDKLGKTAMDLTKSNGSLAFACPSNCVIGDGKTKLHVAAKNRSQQAFTENGIKFGKIMIDSLTAETQLKDGKLEVTKFEAKSGDGELHVDFQMTLNSDFGLSTVNGCLRFKSSDALVKREPETAAELATTGAPASPKDGLFNMKLDGTWRDMRRLGQLCGPEAANKSMDNPGAGSGSSNTIRRSTGTTSADKNPSPGSPPPGMLPKNFVQPPPPTPAPGTAPTMPAQAATPPGAPPSTAVAPPPPTEPPPPTQPPAPTQPPGPANEAPPGPPQAQPEAAPQAAPQQ